MAIITPAYAEELLSKLWDKQRKLDHRHITYLSLEMDKGRWEPGVARVHLVDVEHTGERVLVDGQHTLSAIIKSNKPQDVSLVIDSRKDYKQVSELFSRIDVGRSRSVRDSIHPFGVTDRTSLPPSVIGQLLSAIAFVERGFGTEASVKMKTPHVDSIAKVEDWAPYAVMYRAYLSNEMPRHVRRQLFSSYAFSVGIVLSRYVKNQDVVKEYWDGVAYGVGLKPKDPRATLRNRMSEVVIRGGTNTTNKAFTATYLSKLYIGAWNAYYEGRELSRINTRKGRPTLSGVKYY